MLRQIWDKLTGKKEKSEEGAPGAVSGSASVLEQFTKGKDGRRQLFRLMRDPKVRQQVALMAQRMRADGIDLKNEQQVTKWMEKHKEELERPPEGSGPAPVTQTIRTGPKTGRNDPCVCGSGKKYKKCCGVNAA